MSGKRIAVIGLGSMGKRRLRLLHQIDPYNTYIGIDSREDRRTEAILMAKELGFEISVYDDLDEALAKVHTDAAFVCTSPISHNVVINSCLSSGCHVFSEINLIADGYEDNIDLAEKNNLILYLSSTPMFRREMQYITDRVSPSDKVSYIYHVGQYLPDWHPWENYKDSFFGLKQTNGCREIFAIELPWMTGAFGDIEDLSALSRRMTSLDIDYDDSFNVLISHSTGIKGMMAVDVVCRYPVRNLEIYGEEIYIKWDGSPQGLYEYDPESKELRRVNLYDEIEHQDGYNSLIIENAYKAEVSDFLEVIDGKRRQGYGFEQDLKILSLIDRIENER